MIYKVLSGICLAGALIGWSIDLIAKPYEHFNLCTFTATGFSILFICFSCIAIVRAFGKKYNPFLVFAIADIAVGLLLFLLALADFQVNGRGVYLGSLVGGMLMLFGVNTSVVLLLADALVGGIDLLVQRIRKR